MSEVKFVPANIDAKSRTELLCIPTAGPFDANCSLLKWVSQCYNKKKKLINDSVSIPSVRVRDFEAGEKLRGQSGFYVARRKLRKIRQMKRCKKQQYSLPRPCFHSYSYPEVSDQLLMPR